MNAQIDSNSKQWVRCAVATKYSGAWINLSTNTAYMGFMSPDEDAPAAWYIASWEIDSTTTPNKYYVRLLVGPGSNGPTLSDGIYQVRLKIVTPDEAAILIVPNKLQVL